MARAPTILDKLVPMRNALFCAAALLLGAVPFPASADEGTDEFVPHLLGAQYTFIDQHQDPLHSPYSGPLSLRADGDTKRSDTVGAYFGVPLPWRLQFYLDMEMFKGAGVSNATGMAGLSNGDVIRSGVVNLGKRPYVARRYWRYTLPLGEETESVAAAQDQLAGTEFTRRIEIKLGKFAANDDFDKNRYANSTRTQFMNWALFNDAAWDFAADTRGYTNGVMLALVQPTLSLRYGVFQDATRSQRPNPGGAAEPSPRRAGRTDVATAARRIRFAPAGLPQHCAHGRLPRCDCDRRGNRQRAGHPCG
jgi:hypothetical protein